MYLWMAAVVAVLSAALNLVFGRWEFAGFDLSPLIDSAWRLANGQIPNVSFICTFPPSIYLPTELAFKVFGMRWLSVLLVEDVLYLLLCLLGLRLCRVLAAGREEGGARSLAWIYVGAQTIILLCVNHLWHSTTASGFAAYAILGAYAMLQPSLENGRWEVTAHVSFAFAVLLLSKPNTAWTTVLLCVVCLLLERRSRMAAAVALVAAGVADVAVLGAFHISPAEVLRGYSGLAGRAIPQLFLVGIQPNRSRAGEITLMLTYLFLALPAYRLIKIAWEKRAGWWRSPADLLCLGAGGITLIGLGTNWDIKVVDVPPFLVGAALLTRMHPSGYRPVLRALQWSVALFCVFAVVVGFGRLRMIADGSWAGPAHGKKVWVQDRFFGEFRTREAFAELLREVDTVVAESGGKRIFFGPRMEFLYAREGLTSPLHLPLWWHPGTSYPVSSEAQVERSWVDDRFDVLIFAKKDRTLFPGVLLEEIQEHYRLDDNLREVDVYYREGPRAKEAGTGQ